MFIKEKMIKIPGGDILRFAEPYKGEMNLRKEYFQCWTYKITTERGTLVLIPGISTDRYGITHAFIQMLDGFTGILITSPIRLGSFI